MATGAHFGCPKFTFERISVHFRSICVDHISGHFRSIRNYILIFKKISIAFLILEIYDKMAAVGHFGCPKFTFYRISGHFRSVRNFIFLEILTIAFLAISDQYTTFFLEIYDKMAGVGHFGCPKFTFDRISSHFGSIRNFICFGNFDKMAAVGHF